MPKISAQEVLRSVCPWPVSLCPCLNASPSYLGLSRDRRSVESRAAYNSGILTFPHIPFPSRKSESLHLLVQASIPSPGAVDRVRVSGKEKGPNRRSGSAHVQGGPGPCVVWELLKGLPSLQWSPWRSAEQGWAGASNLGERGAESW